MTEFSDSNGSLSDGCGSDSDGVIADGGEVEAESTVSNSSDDFKSAVEDVMDEGTTYGDAIDEGDKIEFSLNGRRGSYPQPDYQAVFDPDTADTSVDKEIMINHALSGEPFAGAWPRRLFEFRQVDQEQATWLGYRENVQEGPRPVPVSQDAWFRHAAVFGTTGYGKTTFLKNMMIQFAYSGAGFCFIDPKGDGVYDLMRELPEWRMDDVIWVEAFSEDRDRSVGINFLEAGSAETKAEREAEVDGIVEDLTNVLKDEAYWGKMMEGVLSNIARWMVISEKNYTLIDMYYVLLDEDYRQKFTDDVDDEVLQQYAEQINEELDQGDFDALMRRLKKFVENKVTREIISHDKSSFNIKDAVESGKIILVQNNIKSGDAQQMIATGIMRRIWASIKSRAAMDEDDRDPYYLIIDEFDDVVTEDADIDKMLSKARSFKLGVVLCNQQPSQLEKRAPGVLEAMMGNCDNLFAFNPKNPKDARLIMDRFGDFGKSDLLSLGQFRIFTRISVGADQSNPFVFQTFADYPPMRSESEVEEWIYRSLEKYGGPRPALDNVRSNLVLEDNYSPNKDGDQVELDGTNKSGEEVEKTVTERDLLETVWAISLRKHGEGTEYIPTNALSSEIENRFDVYKSEPASQFESGIKDKFYDIKTIDGEMKICVTDEATNWLTDFDTGDARGGGFSHRDVLKKSYEELTKEGYKVTIASQDEGNMPDGIAKVPIDLTAKSEKKLKRKRERIRSEYPNILRISDGEDVNIEAETTTITKPKQTLHNLSKAIDSDRMCLFFVTDGEAKRGSIEANAKTGANIMTNPPCINNLRDNGHEVLYNKQSVVEIEDGVYAARPESMCNQTRWVRKPSGEIRLETGDGNSIMSFDSVESLYNSGKSDFEMYYRHDAASNKYIVYSNQATGGRKREEFSKDEFNKHVSKVREPFIPDREFSRMPEDDDWKIAIMPDDNKEECPVLWYDHTEPEGKRLKPLMKDEKIPTYVDNVADGVVRTDINVDSNGDVDGSSESDVNSDVVEDIESDISDSLDKRDSEDGDGANTTDVKSPSTTADIDGNDNSEINESSGTSKNSNDGIGDDIDESSAGGDEGYTTVDVPDIENDPNPESESDVGNESSSKVVGDSVSSSADEKVDEDKNDSGGSESSTVTESVIEVGESFDSSEDDFIVSDEDYDVSTDDNAEVEATEDDGVGDGSVCGESDDQQSSESGTDDEEVVGEIESDIGVSEYEDLGDGVDVDIDELSFISEKVGTTNYEIHISHDGRILCDASLMFRESVDIENAKPENFSICPNCQVECDTDIELGG